MKKKKKVRIEESTSFDSSEIKKVVITTAIVLIVFACFYFLTVAIVNKDENKSTTDSSSDTGEVEIQRDEILIGTSFSVKEDEYVVVYYDTTDDDMSSLASAISTYRSSSKDVSLYTVDMNNGLNKSFVGEEANKDASNASELSIAGPTLIKFSSNKISSYIEGVDEIVSYLES